MRFMMEVAEGSLEHTVIGGSKVFVKRCLLGHLTSNPQGGITNSKVHVHYKMKVEVGKPSTGRTIVLP